MWGFNMYYSLSFPRGNRRRRRRRKEEEQVRDDVGALEHVSTDALDRADDRCRGEGLCGIKFRAPHAIVATCFRSCVCAMAWRFHAIDAMLSP